MPPRLLIVADPKMLPALSSGLRDGGRFDVIAIPLADPAAAQAAAETADAAALFYGSAAAPLPAALQAMAPKVRERGNRLVAVLQRDQAAHRDDCFRAGASDVLFMPMPRDQFVARLLASVGVVFTPEGSVQSPVAVATRSSTTRLERALVSPLGVEAPAMLPLKTGDTVRLSFAAFQSWGLVVRGGPSAQIRFAGLAPDEEAKIAEWVKSGGKQEPAPAPPRPSPAPMAAAPRPAAAGAPVAQARPPPRPPAPPAAAMPQEAATGARVAPPGPPPAMADRKPARPPAPVTPVQGAKPIAPSGATKGSHPANGQGGALAGLFDKADVPPPAPQPPPAPKGPPWPSSIPLATCKTAAMQVLADHDPGRDVPANVAASARKIAALLSVGERASIQKTGADSYFADAFAARVALDVASAEANRLAAARPAPAVDAEALSTLTRAADEAAARLQKEANAAISKGEVEALQLVTAASASLSRDLLNLKETADKLRGVAAGARLGAGSLDPEVVLPGQQPRPRPPPGAQAPAPVKAELRDFRGLEERPGRAKGVLAAFILAAAIGGVAYAFYFGVPHHVDIPAESAGTGVQRIDVSGTAALVTVTADWVANADANLPKLVQVLRARKIAKAILTLQTGKSAGIVDVPSGKATGLPRPAPAAVQP